MSMKSFDDMFCVGHVDIIWDFALTDIEGRNDKTREQKCGVEVNDDGKFLSQNDRVEM
jgi:hypothetical protein